MRVPTTAVTPSLTGPDGKPLTWVGATPHSTGKPGDPTNITVAVETTNYPEDQGYPPPFTHPLPQEFLPLLRAAEDTWELYANVKFTNVPDAASKDQSADIRVGMADLGDLPTMNFVGPTVGRTTSHYNKTSDTFQPDTLVRIEDPADTPVTRLSNGDYQYSGLEATVFQDLLVELGHALGLGNNPSDPNSIMYSTEGSKNRVPDAQDIAAIQAKYGVPKPHSVALNSSEIATLKGLGILPASFT